MKTKGYGFDALCKLCKANSKEELFEEMTNCLETEVTEENFSEHVDEFVRSYESWVNSQREF